MGKEVATKVASITQKNPQRARELNEQLRQRQEARSEQNRPSDCEAYAQMLKELDQEKATCSATFAVIRRFGGGGPGRAGPVTGTPPTLPESLRQARAEQHDAGTDHAQGHAQPVAP